MGIQTISNVCAVVALIFQQAFDVDQRAVHLLLGIELPKLKLAAIDDLRVGGTWGRAQGADVAHEIIGTGQKNEIDLVAGGELSQRFHVREPSGIEKLMN